MYDIGFCGGNAALKRAKIGRWCLMKGSPAASTFFLLLEETRCGIERERRRRKSSERFMPLLSSYDRYRPRDKRRITGIKQLPRRTATAIPVSMMYHCTRIFPIASFLDPIERICASTCALYGMRASTCMRNTIEIASTSGCENSKEILEKETQTGGKVWNRDAGFSWDFSVVARRVTRQINWTSMVRWYFRWSNVHRRNAFHYVGHLNHH